jgi:hypothetical protein
MTGLLPYQYVVLRCVPRVDREEFLNVGVVVYCEDAGVLAAAWRVEQARLLALAPTLDREQLLEALAAVDRVCAGTAHLAYAAGERATAYGTRVLDDSLSARFGLLKAPKSTVLQPGPVHGGMTADPRAELEHLVSRLVD